MFHLAGKAFGGLIGLFKGPASAVPHLAPLTKPLASAATQATQFAARTIPSSVVINNILGVAQNSLLTTPYSLSSPLNPLYIPSPTGLGLSGTQAKLASPPKTK